MNNLTSILIIFISLGVLIMARFFYVQKLKKLRKALIELKSADSFKRLRFDSADWAEITSEFNEIVGGIYSRLEKITLEKNELQAIISSMAEGVIIIDPKERVQFVSSNLNSMLEMRSQQGEGRLYWEVIRNQQIKDSIKEALNEKQIVRKEIAILGQEESYFNIQISPVFSSQKELVSIVAVFHDITKLAKFERMRSEFVANVSHELKTPLTSIKGFVETLKSGAMNDEKNAQRFLDIIAKHTERLERLVEDLLTLSAIESKEDVMDCSKENLATIIQTSLQMTKGQLEKKQQVLTLNIPSNLPMAIVDRQRIEQVFINLLDNAIKFTPEKGKIEIKATKDNDFIRVDITDSGIGISKEDMSRIFERFYRVDRARTAEMGTGLGLSIVKHIIHAHQGKIAVQSDLNKGTTFSIFLPISSS